MKINFHSFLMTVIFVTASVCTTSAQKTAHTSGNTAYISEFEEGRVLNANDIRFLNSITNGTDGTRMAMINGKKFTPGQKITNVEAAMINWTKSNFRRHHKTDIEMADNAKTINRSPANAGCYWYHYCDNSNYCYYVWYCN